MISQLPLAQIVLDGCTRYMCFMKNSIYLNDHYLSLNITLFLSILTWQVHVRSVQCCFSVTVDVNVTYAEAKLSHATKTITTPIDPNDPGAQPIRWTKNVVWNKAEIEFHNKFPDLGRPPLIDPTGDKHYVTDFKFGIIAARMELSFERGI